MKFQKVPVTHKQELIAQIQLLRIANERNIPDLAMIHRIVGKMKQNEQIIYSDLARVIWYEDGKI